MTDGALVVDNLHPALELICFYLADSSRKQEARIRRMRNTFVELLLGGRTSNDMPCVQEQYYIARSL